MEYPSVAVLHADSPQLVDVSVDRASLRHTVLAVIRYRELLRHLVQKDLKLKYRGSMLGFVWSLVNPILMIVVYTVAFRYIIGVRSSGFVFLVLIGILTWTFFANSAGMAAGAIVDSGGLLKTIFFPRAVVPIASVLFNFVQFLLTISVFVPVLLLLYRVTPGAVVLYFPLVLALQLSMTVGIALALATGTAFFRDLRHLVEVALGAVFWMTPIVYEFRAVPDAWRPLVLLSPVSPFVIAYQEIFFYGQAPSGRVWSAAAVYAVLALSAGFVIFARCQHQFAEQT